MWNIFFHVSKMSKNIVRSGLRQVKRNRTFSCSENLYDRLKGTASAINSETPERRCSSRTFRYGYLVTT